MKKEQLKPSLVLGAICIMVAALLAVVNLFTGPVIDRLNADKANAALLEVLPGAKDFKSLTIDEKYPPAVTDGWSADGGFVFQMSVTGYKPGLVIMCGLDADGKITGVKHITSSETYGLEGQLNDAYVGKDTDSLELIIATGATANSMTSKGYYTAIDAALKAYTVANGGTVDNRDPAQILQDNCNAALGTTGNTFTKWLAVETVDGIDAVYETEGGRVFVFGEIFVGVKADGTVATEGVDAETSAKALAADAVIGAITYTDVAKPADAKAQIVSIKLASNGTYVFELKADGYQVKFDYGDGTPIMIRLAISADGKIIDCRTESQGESAGFGDACATDEYTEQYKGKGDGDIVISSKYPMHHEDDLIPSDSTDIGAITSATYTTVGYQTAIKAAFAAFNTLTATTEGGNE